jgi:hypothetical protein
VEEFKRGVVLQNGLGRSGEERVLFRMQVCHRLIVGVLIAASKIARQASENIISQVLAKPLWAVNGLGKVRAKG